MNRVNIDSHILEQMNRQIEMAYWISGTVIALAIFVVGYQVAINTKTIKSLKKENAEGIKKTAKELFRITLQTAIKLGGYRFIDFKEYLEIYKNVVGYDKEIQNLLVIIKSKAIQESISSIAYYYMHDLHDIDILSIADEVTYINKKEDIIKVLNEKFKDKQGNNSELSDMKKDKLQVAQNILMVNNLFSRYNI